MFSIEKVTKEFFNEYKDLFLCLKDEIEKILEVTDDAVKFDIIKVDFEKKATELRIAKKQQEFQESMSPYEHRTRTSLSPYSRNLRSKRSKK